MREFLFALHIYFIYPILSVILLALFAYVIMSWLISFNVLPRHNRTVFQIYNFLGSVIEPLVRPFRNFIPPLGGLDLSVLIFALTVVFLRDWALPHFYMVFPA